MITLSDNIKIYVGIVTRVTGEPTAQSLSYEYIAVNVNDHSNIIKSTEPAKPRRPFDGNIEIEEPLEVGGAIMVYEWYSTNDRRLMRSLILIDQEKYAVTECPE